MVQKLTTYEHYHLELYKKKFKHHVNMAQADDSDDSNGEQEVAMASVVSSPEKRRGNLTLAGDIEDAGGTEELLDLSLKLYKALPPRSRAPLSAPPPARTPEEGAGRSTEGKASRPRNRLVAL